MTSDQAGGGVIAHAATVPSTNIIADETVLSLHNQQIQDQHPDPDKQQDEDAVCDVLSFAEVPNDISDLPVPRGQFAATSTSATSTTSADEPNAIPIPLDTPALSRSTTNNTIRTSSSGSFTGGTTTNPNNNNSAAYTHAPASAQSHHQPPPSAIRKTSPGLAARLKALGFGTSKQSPAAPTLQNDHIGRLDEQQLRQLDEKHQANSISSIIARRGRPWKGAGASTSALLNSTAEPIVAADTPQLPEIRTPEPLAMDTQKYRLPDHTNGNGTKVTLDTRREHIERTTRPPSPPETNAPAAVPPPPPPKDTLPLAVTPPPAVASSNDYVPGLGSYFTPGHNRPGSIYTLSRASFANQLAQLTSLQLPDAESLSSKVSAIRTAHVATKALINASEQIRSWISKAQEVIGGLDSEDDVEWAAAGGREGLEEVENAITRFEDLINAYVGAIEELQKRSDISHVPSEDLKMAVTQMEMILDEWEHIRATLQSVRVQVEIAMEWEELWNNVLGDIQGEMDELSRLVFEMEEVATRAW
ncbi:Karyogamy protein, KAR9 [Pochonia chlamydosporia 170]|uniref:Karyogamy protein, KAR9 n=1 Tax=Pochonia chlamydosporia 170 TaxID=1380566 RepID=A0A219ARQ8_METCM|nr:Karyogamy protein, KAR9 [Pochonia chlamydosporia 170]OWT43453.1 Karyogamy protein, KAR9 [Pochonia chlamydosporia 170]